MLQLYIEKLKLALQKRTGTAQKKKGYEAWKAKGYNNNPTVSIIIQQHNKSLQVLHVLPKLRQYDDNAEIIVIDDGSDFEHTERLTKALTGANEFMLRANDLFENVTYDRAIRFANGKYVALLQDDDDFDDTTWITEALQLFETHPKLAILGGKGGLAIAFEHDRRWAHGGPSQISNDGKFTFVTAVNRAPMWINRELFLAHLRHIDYRFAPFQFDDYALCAECWLRGLQVGWYDAHFHSLTAGGMRVFNSAFTQKQSERNGKLLYELYVDKEEQLMLLLESARGDCKE